MMIKGYLINYIYKTPRELIKINQELIGRIVKNVKKGTPRYYYYPGTLDDKKYFRITKGCFFCTKEHLALNPEWYKITVAELELNDTTILLTAREMWKELYNGIYVKHLN